MDIIGQNWIRFENNRKVKYRCSRSDFIVSGRFFDRGTWNYPEERFGRIENPLYFCTRRDGRVVDCGGLKPLSCELGFESLSPATTGRSAVGKRCSFLTMVFRGGNEFIRVSGSSVVRTADAGIGRDMGSSVGRWKAGTTRSLSCLSEVGKSYYPGFDRLPVTDDMFAGRNSVF